MSYIELNVRTAYIVHGYDANNQEITEEVGEKTFVKKLILLDRIQSVSDKYLLVTSAHGRVMYWEYEGGFEALKSRLDFAGKLI